jgi:hypothetical protein
VSSYKIARRAFLRGTGAAALLWPLLRNIEAFAQTGQAPKRFLVIHHPIGTVLDRWRPSGGATTSEFTLPYISAPYEPLRPILVMIDGLNIVAASRVAAGPTGDKTHEGGMVAIMTGQPTLGRIGQQDHSAGGASIDQILLERSPMLGGAASTMKTPFGSLQLAADIRSDRSEVSPRVLSYRAPTEGQSDINLARKPLYPDTQPLNVYSRIFGAASGVPLDAEQAAALLARKKSALDFMRSDLARLRTLVPASEKDKLDAHAQAIASLEATLQRTIVPVPGGDQCVKPMAPMAFVENGKGQAGSTLSGADYYAPGEPDFHPHELIGRAHLAMIRAAFACDLVRTATFMWSAGTNWVVFPGALNGKQITGGAESSPHHPPSHTTDAATVDWIAEIHRFYAEQTAAALLEFQAQIDVDGGSMLDNTVVVVLSEVGRAYDHDFRNVPLLVFGSPKVRIEGGRFLSVSGGPLPTASNANTGNRPTNALWLSLAPIFGVELPSLGSASQDAGGPLPDLVSPA